ncbi:hypothetical protein Dimus_017799, partial [Dionaea muscipula]
MRELTASLPRREKSITGACRREGRRRWKVNRSIEERIESSGPKVEFLGVILFGGLDAGDVDFNFLPDMFHVSTSIWNQSPVLIQQGSDPTMQ